MKSKICLECEQVFQPKSSRQIFCSEKHYRTCLQCSNEFLVPNQRLNTKRSFCSNSCASKFKGKNLAKSEAICLECKCVYKPKHFNQKYCNKEHSRVCVICERGFTVVQLSKGTSTCSVSCAMKLGHSEKSKSKRIENNLKNYGVAHTFQRREVKDLIYSNQKVVDNFYGNRGFTATMLAKYGVENGFQLPQANPRKISKSNKKWKKILEERTQLSWSFERFFKGVGCIDLTTEVNGKIIAVEVSPTATHNVYKNLVSCNKNRCVTYPCVKHARDRYYHYNKAKVLKETYGVNLVTIFDWSSEKEIVAKVISLINNNSKELTYSEPGFVFSKGEVAFCSTEALDTIKGQELVSEYIKKGWLPIWDC